MQEASCYIILFLLCYIIFGDAGAYTVIHSFHIRAINSLGPSDAIWRWRSWATLVQIMACCLTAPSHYLNQCWLIIRKALWHSSKDIIIRRFEDTNQQNKIENYIFKITLRSPRGQWVNNTHTGGRQVLGIASILRKSQGQLRLVIYNQQIFRTKKSWW